MVTPTNTSAPPIIRLAHPLAFAAFLKHIGAPTERHFRRQGLPVLWDSPNEFVPLRQAWSFFDATAQAEDPMLGWHVGRYVGDHNLNSGLLGKLEGAPTLYQALQRLVRLVSSEASHLQIGIQERRDDILFYTHYPDMKEVPGYTSSQAYQLEVYLDLIRHFVGRQWVPDEIAIEYPAVPAVVEGQLPGSRILTHQRVGYVAVTRSCLHMAARGGATEDSGGDSFVLTKSFNYADTLAALLKPHLAAGYPTARFSASLMDTSERTLARRLSACGRKYQSVIDEVRFNVGRELLLDPNLRITEVARAVGFDDAAHFARMFRRVGGLSPREFRRATPG